MSDPRKTPSIFTRGAVDLGALRPAPATPTSSAPPAAASAPVTTGERGPALGPAPAGGGVAVIDVTEATLQTEVLERSLRTPVIMHFMIPRSAPCQQLGAMLEQLAVADGGAWVLANVDVEANPRLAQLFRVPGVPLVYAVVGGQPVDAFNGVIPEAQLRQWISAVCGGAGVELAPTDDPRMVAADDALADGDLDRAESAYQKILADSPADPAAESGLAQVGLLRRTIGVDPRRALAAAAAAPQDLAAQLRAADVEVLAGRAPEGYQRLVNLIRAVTGEDREAVRKHLLSLFAVAGPDDPAVARFRRALASALF